MFCPGCGTENPGTAVFCYKCGAQMPQAGPGGQGFMAADQPLATGAAPAFAQAPAPEPSYLWGYIQGWGMLIGSPIMFLLFVAVLLAPTSDADTRKGAIMFLVLLALATVTGFGLARKMRMGLRLVYIWAGLHGVFILIGLLAMLGAPGDRNVHIAAVAILMGAVFWFICAAYYHRRRGLFR